MLAREQSVRRKSLSLMMALVLVYLYEQRYHNYVDYNTAVAPIQVHSAGGGPTFIWRQIDSLRWIHEAKRAKNRGQKPTAGGWVSWERATSPKPPARKSGVL